MSSTDDRIVRMQFDNKQFMKGAADTQKALADTNKAVDGAGKGKGLLDLQAQMGQVGVTASKMSIITTTALATIANKVTNVGLSMVKSLTFDPIKQGFSEYESLLTKQNTIMNATGKSATEVKAVLSNLNKYSDQTIYSFGNMTDAITKFVNAGVPLKQSVTSIKGIANAAAFAGASSEEANRAMYAFSQSMSLGFIQLQDWNQIENANLGTQTFKNSLLEAGVAAGTLTKRGKQFITQSGTVISATKGWRDGLQEQWATTEVLNSALGKYADRSTTLGKKAFAAAQEVRTFTAFMDTLKESIGSGWAGIFTALFGNLKQATSFWTGLSNAVGGVVKSFFTFATTALTVWRRMGGFEKVMQGFKNILAPIGALLGAIGDAWAAAFPSSDKGAGKALYGLSAGFELLTRPLAWLAKGIPAITPLLTVLFSVIGAGVSIVKNGIGALVDLVKVASDLVDVKAPNSGGFLGFIQSIVAYVKDAISKINTLVSKAKGLGGAIGDSLGSISLPGISLPSLPSISGPDTSGATDAASKSASGMQVALNIITGLAAKMGDVFSGMWDQIKTFFAGFNMKDLVSSINLAILGTLGVSIARFLNALTGSITSFAGLGKDLKNTLGEVQGALKSYQSAQNAKKIMYYAIAIGILAGALWLLSKVPIKNMVPALAAMGAIFFMMQKSMQGFSKVLKETDGITKSVNMVALAASIVLIAGAMLLFALSMLIMNKVEWQSVAKGLITMAAGLKMVQAVADTAAGSWKQMLGGAVAIAAISVSMVILAGALLLFKLVDWGSMGKAGAALLGITLAVGALALIPYQGIAKVGFAMLAASVGMIAIANALIMFALVKWESIGKAAVILGVLALAIAGIMILGGGGAGAAMILAVAGAMVALALACIMFNAVDWSSIAKAAVVLTLLVVAVAAFAAILTIFLYAIAPVAPVLLILAGGFALLGLGLLAFAAAMALAVTLGAAGAAAFAVLATGMAVAIGVFLQTLALQAPIMKDSILALLQTAIDTIVEAVPMVIKGFKDLFKAIVKELSSGDKKQSFGDTVSGWLDKLTAVARKFIPKIVRLGLDIVLGFIKGLQSRVGEFATLGIQFLTSLIKGIGQKVGQLVTTAVSVVIKFAEGMEKNAFRLANAGINLIATFLHDLASAIRNGGSAIGGGLTDVLDAMKDVGMDMVRGIIEGVEAMAGDALNAIGNLGSNMVNKAKDILKIWSPSRVFKDIGKFVVQGLTKGVQDNATSAIVAVAGMITGAIAVADDYVSKYFQKLDQQAIEARAKADGLMAAAQRAAKSAEETKTKDDDHAARRMAKRAREAAKEARQEEKEARDARKRRAAKEKWEKASSADRAEMRAKSAQSNLAGAKNAERAAEAARIEAIALRQAAKNAGNKEEREKLIKAAKAAQKEAREQAERANQLIKNARKNSRDAIKFQRMAGDEAAAYFEKQYANQAKADADAEAFEKLSDAEKAAQRKKEAEALQKKADQELKNAKKLAYTDLKAANALAEKAMEDADAARDLFDEAQDYQESADAAGAGTPGAPTGTVVNLSPSDAAAQAYNGYSDTYDSAYAAAAAGKTVQFNQYNQSPESLSAADIYRNTNNQLTFAADQLGTAA